jgi:hypothetical protein
VGLRDRLKRLEREAEGEMLVIPQRDGSPARFPASAAKDAFINLMNRLGTGEDAPPEHPLIGAIRNPTDSKWAGSFFVASDPDERVKPIPDLSE